MGKKLAPTTDEGSRVIDPGIAAARKKAEELEAYWTAEGEKETQRLRAEQAKEYGRVIALVERAEALLGRRLRLDVERALWYFLRCGRARGWLPPADWGRNAWVGSGGEAEMVARRTLYMVDVIRDLVPDIASRRLWDEVLSAEPWRHRGGSRRPGSLAPEAWVFALLLEAEGAAWDAELLKLVYDLVVYAKGAEAPSKRHGGQKAQAVRQALKPRDRKTGEERLRFARRMARLWYIRDVWGLEARIQARRGNHAAVAPQKLT